LRQIGFDTGIDMPALLDVVDLISEMLGQAPQGGRAQHWLRQQVAVNAVTIQ
jgi:hydroxymethylglutaryl-CoA lyase